VKLFIIQESIDSSPRFGMFVDAGLGDFIHRRPDATSLPIDSVVRISIR
jgi:hypothetical protein